MKESAKIAALYTLFAAIATAANLLSQFLCIRMYSGPRAIEVSILVGTAVGLPLKYALEKRYIFRFSTTDLAHDSRLFLLYSAMGLATTCVFWGTEYLFHLVFVTELMRYVGGAIGLTVGYYIKYRLDKRFVFVNRSRVPG